MSAGPVVGIVVGAGSGQRLGAEDPKSFVELAGVPMFVHAVAPFLLSAAVDDVVVVVGPGHVDRAAAALHQAGFPDVTLCEGGATRSESVRSGLQACSAGSGVVAVHDAARPLLPVDLLERILDALVDPWAAVAPGLPVVDTLKLVDETREAVVRTVDRRGLWAVQTPQVFAHATLRRVYERLGDEPATDDLVLVERAGGRVRMVRGDARNLKVTFPADLRIAEALLAAGTR